MLLSIGAEFTPPWGYRFESRALKATWLSETLKASRRNSDLGLPIRQNCNGLKAYWVPRTEAVAQGKDSEQGAEHVGNNGQEQDNDAVRKRGY
jgi:hypothetical protein